MKIYVSTSMTGRTVASVERQQGDWSDVLRAAGLAPVIPHYAPRDEPAQIVPRDLALIATCDALLLDARHPSWGAACEMMFAAQRGKVVGAVYAGDPGLLSPFVIYHCVILGREVRDVVDRLKAVLGDGVTKRGEWLTISAGAA